MHRTVRGDSEKHRTNYGTAELSVFDGAASDRQLHIAGAQGAGGGRISAGTIDPPWGLSGIDSADRKSVCRQGIPVIGWLEGVGKENWGSIAPVEALAALPCAAGTAMMVFVARSADRWQDPNGS